MSQENQTTARRQEFPVTVSVAGSISMEDAIKFAPVLVTMKKAAKMQEQGRNMTDSHFIAYTHKVGTRTFKEAAFLMHTFKTVYPDALKISDVPVEATEPAQGAA